MSYLVVMIIFAMLPLCRLAYAEEKKPVEGWDVVSDTVQTTFNKATALLTGNLEVKMDLDKRDNKEEFVRNAIGQKVPKSTAIKSAGSLHNDDAL